MGSQAITSTVNAQGSQDLVSAHPLPYFCLCFQINILLSPKTNHIRCLISSELADLLLLHDSVWPPIQPWAWDLLIVLSALESAKLKDGCRFSLQHVPYKHHLLVFLRGSLCFLSVDLEISSSPEIWSALSCCYGLSLKWHVIPKEVPCALLFRVSNLQWNGKSHAGELILLFYGAPGCIFFIS